MGRPCGAKPQRKPRRRLLFFRAGTTLFGLRGSSDMHEPHATLQQHWLRHARGIGLNKPSMPLFSKLVAAYSEPRRHYHSLRHWQECLQLLERRGKGAAARHEVGMALWFHYAIYDAQREDNEDKSARWAAQALKELRAAEEAVRLIVKLIRSTRHSSRASSPRRLPEMAGVDLMLDIDLTIHGADRARFEDYERQVRFEYAHLSNAAFAQGRADFVEALLGRTIYRTEVARSELEGKARESLTRALKAWRAA